MSAIASLEDLFVDELKDIYSAEKQITKALPKLIRSAEDGKLREALSAHLKETEEHVSRLQQVFRLMDASERGPKCKGMEGLLEEGAQMMKKDLAEDVVDAAIIASAQRVEHYEIAAYGTVCTYAKMLGHEDALRLLKLTLGEEEAADQKLSKLAEGGINSRAMAGQDGNGDRR